MEDLKNNKKRKAILAKSKELFWKYGFRRVTIEEICREAKTSKMTFYRFFPNKLELAKAVLDQFYGDSLLNFRKIMRDDSSASVKMKELINLKLEGTNEISDEFIRDFYTDAAIELKSYMEEKIKYICKESIKDFKLGQEKGWIRKDLNVEFMFYFSRKITLLLKDKELMNLYNSPRDLIMELANLFVYGITPSK